LNEPQAQFISAWFNTAVFTVAAPGTARNAICLRMITRFNRRNPYRMVARAI